MNWQLLRAGFPLAIIQFEERARYLQALDEGHSGNRAPLWRLIADAAERTLDLLSGGATDG
jgi:hypothetical protein